MKSKFAVVLLPLLAMSSVADAGSIAPPANNIDNKAYAGLKFELPSLAPALVLGVRRVRTQADGDTQGGDLSMAVSFAGGAKPGKLRLKGFTGSNSYQAEAGGGYNFANPGLFVGAGVNAPYVNMGADFQSGSGLMPFIMLDTLGKAKKPAQSLPL
jgi:hypothetical protein